MNWPTAFAIVGVSVCIIYALATLPGPVLVAAALFLILGGSIAGAFYLILRGI